MNLIKNKPWKAWKTRKITFIIVSLIWLTYAIIGLFGVEVSVELLDFIYKAGVWLLGFGVTLVLSDKIADKLVDRRSNIMEEVE